MPEELIAEMRQYYTFKDYAAAKSLLESHPYEASPDYWYFLANANRKLGNRIEAERCCKKTLEISPNDRRAKFELGLLYQDEGNYAEALKFLEQAASAEDGDVDFDQQVDILNSLALTYKKNKDYKKALDIYKETSDFLFNVANKKAIALWKKENGDKEPTKEELYFLMEKLLRSNLLFCTLLNNRGTAYAELGDNDSARRAFQESIKFTPEFLEFQEPQIGLQQLES